MRKRRTRLIAAGLSLVMLGSCVGCGERKSDKKSGEDGKTELTIWVREQMEDPIMAAVKQYNEKQDKVKVNAVVYPDNELTDQLTLALSSGDVPDMVSLDDILAPYYNSQKALADVTEKFNDLEFKDAFSKGMVELGTYEGKQYAIPFAPDVSVLFYNKEHFRQQFRVSLIFTLKYTLLVTPALFLVAFVLALLIDGRFKGATLFRSIYFSPVVISMTSCSLIWLWIYNDLYGILNYILQKFHIIDESILWMGEEKTSLPAIVFMITWKMAGFSMLIILAAFQSVDTQVYESASIDGASKLKQFFHITLPIIRPQVGLALIMSVIGSVLAFEQFLIMTKGGPTETTTTLVHYIYNTSFKYYNFGYGSAMTMILLIIMLVLSVAQMRLLKDPTE